MIIAYRWTRSDGQVFVIDPQEVVVVHGCRPETCGGIDYDPCPESCIVRGAAQPTTTTKETP